MRILFIPTYYDGLPRDSGSVKLRAEWVCRHWPEAAVYDGSQRFAGAQLYVFQKAYLVARTREWIQKVAKWRDRGRCRLAFDLCDPDFLEPEHARRMSALLPLFDFATVTTEALGAWMEQRLPTYVIPDRVDLEELDKIGRKTDTSDTDEPRLVWAGYERNVPAMRMLQPRIEELGLEADVLVMDSPIPFENFWRMMLQYDVLLNPRPDVPPFSYKSDNKTLIAWALGLPVARTAQELEELCDPEWRRVEAASRRAEVESDWSVALSVQEWQRIAKEWMIR